MSAAEGRRLPLLSAMSRDLADHGALQPLTATGMWSAYAAHTSVTAWALRRRAGRLPVPAIAAKVVGTVLAGVGAGVCVAGMSRFAGPRELTGTRNQSLATTGVYRYTRNPQYLGYLLALTGAALARRSGSALACTVALAAVYASWIPVEERHLASMYGQEYVDYTHRARRWWGRTPSG